MHILGQTDPTQAVSSILSYPVETLLAGVLLLLAVVGIIIARAFARWVANVDKMFARRDEIDTGLMAVIKETGTAINASVVASKQSASTAERTEQAVTSLSANIKQESEVQRLKIVPALAAIYKRLTIVEGKLDKCNSAEIHRELQELRGDLRSAMLAAQKPPTVIVGDTSKLNPNVLSEGNNHHEP